MQTEGNANHFVSIGINFGILLISIFPTWIVHSELEHSHEIEIRGDDVTEPEAAAELSDQSSAHKRPADVK